MCDVFPQSGQAAQLHKVVRVDSVCQLLVWEVPLVDLRGNDGLQRTLDRVAAEVIGAGPFAGIKKDLGLTKPALGQLLKISAVHESRPRR